MLGLRTPRLLTVLLACACVLGCNDDGNEASTAASEPAPLRVRAHRVESGTARSWVYAQGTVEALERKVLTFEMDGRVAYIAESEEGRTLQVGDRVRGPDPDAGEGGYGQLLMSLDNREQAASVSAREAELRRTRSDQAAGSASVESAKAELELAEAEFERMQALVAAQAAAQADLDSARSRYETAKAALDSARAQRQSSRSGTSAQEAELARARIGLEKGSIFAPFDGVIAYLNVKEGDYFFAGSLSGRSAEERLELAPIVIVDPSAFEITVQLPSFEADAVARGQTAIILSGTQVASVSAGERSIFDEDLQPVFAEVYAVSPSVNPSSRTVEVKLRTTAGAEQLRDGEFVTCWIITQVSSDTVLAPFDIVVRGESGPRAFVISEDSMQVEARALRFGIRDMVGVEIVEGLGHGDYVVTEGRHALAEGAAVEVVGEDTLPNQPGQERAEAGFEAKTEGPASDAASDASSDAPAGAEAGQ